MMPLSAPIAVTMGEPAGIGGEVTLKAWQARKADGPAFFVIDDPKRLADLAAYLGLPIPIAAINAPASAAAFIGAALPVLPLPAMAGATVTAGKPSAATAKAVIAAIDKAVELTRSGAAAAMVTAPIHKETLQEAGFGFPGHTEYLGHLAGGMNAVMMLTVETAAPPLRVVPVTVHLPISRVVSALSTAAIVDAATTTALALARDFGIEEPRLAVAALNPHAGEGGHMGSEEATIIAPAIAQLRAAGHDVTGPAPADTLFHVGARARYDAVICMYHDQALIPLKTVDFAAGVNVTLGLPFVRTSPDHGTAFDIAGRGSADPTSMIAAINLAARLAAHRGGA
jgi:4-hydroxythreonine-4-phosphate dehydrogenase